MKLSVALATDVNISCTPFYVVRYTSNARELTCTVAGARLNMNTVHPMFNLPRAFQNILNNNVLLTQLHAIFSMHGLHLTVTGFEAYVSPNLNIYDLYKNNVYYPSTYVNAAGCNILITDKKANVVFIRTNRENITAMSTHPQYHARLTQLITPSARSAVGVLYDIENNILVVLYSTATAWLYYKTIATFASVNEIITDDYERALFSSIITDAEVTVVQETYKTWYDAQIEKYQPMLQQQAINVMIRTVQKIKRDAVDAYNRQVTDLEAKLTAAYTALHTARLAYHSVHSTTEELLAFVNQQPEIKSITTHNNLLHVTIKAAVEYYDAAALKTQLNNSRSDVGSDPIKQIMQDIFIDHKYNLLFGATVVVPLVPNASSFPSCLEYTDGINLTTGLVNPHLGYVNCFGQYRSQLIKAAIDGDFVTVLALAIASVKSWNVLDGTVTHAFCTRTLQEEEMWRIPCLYKDDPNNCITLLSAYPTIYTTLFEGG